MKKLFAIFIISMLFVLPVFSQDGDNNGGDFLKSRSFPISAQFAEILYKKAVSLIANFKATGISPLIGDGYVVTFRTVVDDEVWSLKIHCPAGDALKMSNLCKQITMETLATGKPDESRYIKMLDDFN